MDRDELLQYHREARGGAVGLCECQIMLVGATTKLATCFFFF